MHLLVASAFSWTQGVLGLIGGGGLITAIIAIVKLRPDVNTAAVTQSQGAMEQMVELQTQLRLDRDEWRSRALAAEEECREMKKQLARRPSAHRRPPGDKGS